MPDARFKKMIRVSKPLSTHTPTFNRAHTKSIQLRKYYSTFVIIRIILIIFIIDEIFSFHFFTSKFTRSAELSVNLVIEKSCGERGFFSPESTLNYSQIHSSLTKSTQTHSKTTTLSAKQHFLVFDVQIVHTRNTFKKISKKDYHTHESCTIYTTR